MARYALVEESGDISSFNSDINPDKLPKDQGWPRWLPVVEEYPAYNPKRDIVSGPELVVESERVVERYSVRQKVQEEINSELDKRISAVGSDALKLFEDLEQRISALENKPTKFIDWLKSIFR